GGVKDGPARFARRTPTRGCGESSRRNPRSAKRPRRCRSRFHRDMTAPDMAAHKRVFILGGGAALGAHHVGALRYLEEQGIVPDAIVASSIGVINACAYATGGVD